MILLEGKEHKRALAWGLKNALYLSYKQGSHGPRIKILVSPSKSSKSYDNTISLSISAKPVVVEGDATKISSSNIELVRGWVKINHKVLMEYWHKGVIIDYDEFIDSLKHA